MRDALKHHLDDLLLLLSIVRSARLTMPPSSIAG